MIDSKLNFQNHIKIIESKLSKCVGILYRLKAVLSREVLCKIYFALFHPHLLYGLIACGSTFPIYMSKLESLQDKAVKIIGGSTGKKATTPFYGKLKILKLCDLYKFEIAKLVHDFLPDKLPFSSLFSHLFQTTSQIFSPLHQIWFKKKNSLYRTHRLQVALGIKAFPCQTQYPWKYKILPNIASNSKNIFENFTSDDQLDHLLSHFTTKN